MAGIFHANFMAFSTYAERLSNLNMIVLNGEMILMTLKPGVMEKLGTRLLMQA